jgi:hypothetical protein
VVNVQVESQDAAVGLGVLDPEVYERVWSKPPRAFPESPECAASIRIARADDSRREEWWDLSDPSCSSAIVGAITSRGLAFFDSLPDRSAIVAFLGDADVESSRYPLPRIHLAMLLDLCDRREEARDVLARLALETGPSAWGKRVEQLRARYELQPQPNEP